ncbi:P43 5S RNA-binding protein-like [Aplochiton taeniatus]
MNGVQNMKLDSVLRPQLFNCVQVDCGATFTRQWRLKEHETTHTGARPFQCTAEGCGRRFSRKSHLSRHKLTHSGVKLFRCTFLSCAKSFFNGGNLKRHVRYIHGEKEKYFKCKSPNCSLTFKKRRAFKLHLQEKHGAPFSFKCSKAGCNVKFDSHVTRKAHEKTHPGYRCQKPDCQAFERTWGKMQKHMAKHRETFTCKLCQKVFKRFDALRRHKRTHALQKPVLLCPNAGCQAYFSTTFNLQHHIRKVHLQLLKHRCSFPDCPRTFAMRESLTRHLLLHDPSASGGKLKQQKRQRSKKGWQKRLKGHHQLPLVEEDLRQLFAMRMRVSRKAKVEANLAGLFNERKIRHYIDPEVNLKGLFSLKAPRPALEPKTEFALKA